MKNTNRLLGIIALIAIIGFSFFGCDLASEEDEKNTDGSTAPNRTIIIKNNTGYSIGGYSSALCIKQSSSLGWGSSLTFYPLSNGESYAYTLPASIVNNGTYDIRFKNNSGNGYFTKHYVTVSNGMTLTFTQSDYNDESQYPKITIKNLSGADFNCYLKSSSTSDWGVMMGSVSNNHSTTIKLPILLANFSVFDIQMRSSSTNTYTKNNVTVSDGMTITYFPADSDNSSIIMPVIVIKNNTGYTIGGYSNALWIKQSSTLDWGSGLYGGFTISNGESYTYTLPASIVNNGTYDIRFNNYGGSGYFTKTNVSLSFGMTLTFTGSDAE